MVVSLWPLGRILSERPVEVNGGRTAGKRRAVSGRRQTGCERTKRACFNLLRAPDRSSAEPTVAGVPSLRRRRRRSTSESREHQPLPGPRRARNSAESARSR